MNQSTPYARAISLAYPCLPLPTLAICLIAFGSFPKIMTWILSSRSQSLRTSSRGGNLKDKAWTNAGSISPCSLVVRLNLDWSLPTLEPRYRYGKIRVYDWLQFPREAKGASMGRGISAKEERPRNRDLSVDFRVQHPLWVPHPWIAINRDKTLGEDHLRHQRTMPGAFPASDIR